MLCPNDHAPLHQTTASAQFCQKVVIDQCGRCGGLWFDPFELYKVKQVQDEAIDPLDAEILRTSSDIDNPTLLCPRDKTALFQFKEPRFPKEIILMRCPKCQGFWLNRGEFTKYRHARENLTPAKESVPENRALNAQVEQLLGEHHAGSNVDVLRKAGAFLSSPVGSSLDGNQALAGKGDTLDLFVNALVILLRLFIFRF